MKIVIVGAGAIGMLLGTFLAKGGHQVVFVEKSEETVKVINKTGIDFMETQASGSNDLTFQTTKAVLDADDIKKSDVVILAVKSFDTHAAVNSVRHLITKGSPVLSFQAGLGNLEIIERVVPRENILGGYTFLAGAALSPGHVRLGGHGITHLGELDGKITKRVERLCKVFNDCGLETILSDNILAQLWCKVLVYSAINPLSGILRIKNEQLLEKMESITLAKRLIDEGRQVALATGVDLAQYDLYELFFKTCRHTSGNVSSMLLDLISSRRTEIDAINGEVVRLGEIYNVPTPSHQALVDLIKLSEKWGVGFQGSA